MSVSTYMKLNSMNAYTIILYSCQILILFILNGVTIFIQAAARYIHSTVRNASMTISNMIGPLQQVALGNYPISGLYFTVAGFPEVKKIIIVFHINNLN